MNTQEQEDAISNMEVQLNAQLSRASHLMQDLRLARKGVTHQGMINRGWGFPQELAAFFEMAETVIYDIKSNITEYGGGTTSSQDERLRRVAKVIQEPFNPLANPNPEPKSTQEALRLIKANTAFIKTIREATLTSPSDYHGAGAIWPTLTLVAVPSSGLAEALVLASSLNLKALSLCPMGPPQQSGVSLLPYRLTETRQFVLDASQTVFKSAATEL